MVELDLRLRQNSSNSSPPPSSDGLAKPAPKSLRRKGTGKPGGQTGHDGSTLRQVADPDLVVDHRPPACHGCGAGLDGRDVVGTARRQVFDDPPVAVHVTEHRLGVGALRLRDGECRRGAGRGGRPGQYGPRVAAAAV